MLSNKKILVGVCSSVALYKALDFIRRLKRRGAEVHVMMTAHAAELISPQLFHAVSGHPVLTQLFDSDGLESMPHLNPIQSADLVLILPATANMLAKMSHGLADDLISTSILATAAPVVVVPAMNTQMWGHPAVQSNVEVLQSRGVVVVRPIEGELACGVSGEGHLAEFATIERALERAVTVQDLKGKKVLITCGPTFEALDPVRGLTNRSSGKMGFALAHHSLVRGAEVFFVSSLFDQSTFADPHLKFISVDSAEAMKEAVLRFLPDADVFISAAAVCDYRPISYSPSKLKKSQSSFSVEWQTNPHILQAALAQKKQGQVVVGFALETENLQENELLLRLP